MKLSDKSKDKWPLIEDLYVFLTVIRKEGFSSAASELGLSPAYISKRINLLEKTLNTQLFFRNTRTVKLTSAGEKARDGALALLTEMDDFVSGLSELQDKVAGKIHISCSFGFGSKYLAPAISKLASLYPDLNIRLTLTDKVVDLHEEGVDLEIRIGDDIKDLYIAKKIATNSRVICASPNYFLNKKMPEHIDDLQKENCLLLQERDSKFGSWILNNGSDVIQLPVTGSLVSNSGSVIMQWALDGHGIMCRSYWDVQDYLKSGELIQLFPEWTQNANVWAVYLSRPSGCAKLKVCLDFLEDYFKEHPVN